MVGGMGRGVKSLEHRGAVHRLGPHAQNLFRRLNFSESNAVEVV